MYELHSFCIASTIVSILSASIAFCKTFGTSSVVTLFEVEGGSQDQEHTGRERVAIASGFSNIL